MSGKSSFSALVCDKFGATANLSAHLSDVWESGDKKLQWLLWLSLKSFGEANNHYLTLILGNCDNVDSFEMHAYLDFADVDISHPEFERYYTERKRLLEQLPETAAHRKSTNLYGASAFMISHRWKFPAQHVVCLSLCIYICRISSLMP